MSSGQGAYRERAEIAKPPVGERLDCWLRDGDANRWVRAIYVKMVGTFTAVAFLWTSGARVLAGLAATLGALWCVRDFGERKGAAVRLLVRAGRLRIEGEFGVRELDLEDVLEVRLDTKSTSKNVTQARADGVNSVFGMASGHNIELDLSRIEVETTDERFLLGRARISHSLCAETLRTIRLFLRAHGWKPEDERAATSSEPGVDAAGDAGEGTDG